MPGSARPATVYNANRGRLDGQFAICAQAQPIVTRLERIRPAHGELSKAAKDLQLSPIAQDAHSELAIPQGQRPAVKRLIRGPVDHHTIAKAHGNFASLRL